MTKEEYAEAYMDGANDAWALARRSPEHLKEGFLTAMGAKLLADKIWENHDFGDDKED